MNDQVGHGAELAEARIVSGDWRPAAIGASPTASTKVARRPPCLGVGWGGQRDGGQCTKFKVRKAIRTAHSSPRCCSAPPLFALAAPVVLSGTVGTSTPGYVNFEGGISGLVGNAVSFHFVLRVPTLTATGASFISNSGAGAFRNWYTAHGLCLLQHRAEREFAGQRRLHLPTTTTSSPSTARSGDEGQNYHFTYAIASFGYTRAQARPSPGGDDDVWVYFDKLLGIDLGGVHGFASSTVNLDDLFNAAGPRIETTMPSTSSFAERHTSGSNLTISTSLLLRDNPGQSVPEPGSPGSGWPGSDGGPAHAPPPAPEQVVIAALRRGVLHAEAHRRRGSRAGSPVTVATTLGLWGEAEPAAS